MFGESGAIALPDSNADNQGERTAWSYRHRIPGRIAMPSLPDDAVVVRGGAKLAESFAQGSGVAVDAGGTLDGVSVNSAPGLSLEELTASNSQSGYPGIPHN